MKNVTFLVCMIMLLSCSNNDDESIHTEDAGTHKLGIDASIYEETIIMDNVAREHISYGCAKVYLQIPKQYTHTNTGEMQVHISHELWSIPVQKLPGNEVWKSIDTQFNTAPPVSETSNLREGGSTYAFIITQDGNVLYDQAVQVASASKKWYVCESYYCGANGCQEHENFSSEDWLCSPSQNRLLNEEQFSRCPCMFNNSGYPYCEFKNEET
jgi:hypothetical protein